MLSAHLMLLGRLFHRVAEDVLKIRLPVRMVLFLFGTKDVVDADLSGLFGVYQFSNSRKYNGALLCSDLNVIMSILN